MDEKANNFTPVSQALTSFSISEMHDGNKNNGKFISKSVAKLKSENNLIPSIPINFRNGGLNQRVPDSVNSVFNSKTDVLQRIPTGHTCVQQNTGEFYFINDPVSKQRIIDFISRQLSSSATFCIRSLEDLDKHGLMQQTWLRDGQLHKSDGRLFINDPLTLIFDLTAMTPGDIASFNDMLQADPACNGKPLGPRVKRVCLVNDGMLKGSRPANPDLWRRLGRMTQKEMPAGSAKDTLTDETLLAQITTASILDNKPVVAIDFACSGDWYHRLFGGIALNERGQLYFSEGALANLEEGTHLLIKNAPWDSTGFKESLATAIRAGGFAANRQWIRLPDNMTLSFENVSKTRLNNMKARAINDSHAFNGDSPFVCINSDSIESLTGNVRVKDAAVVRTDKLATLVKDCGQLVITSSLNEKQWLWLLTQLEQLPEPRPMLFAHLPPSALVVGQDRVAANINRSEPRSLNHSDPASFYEVNPTGSLDSLQEVNLTSQNNFTFSLTDSPLMASLVKGTPIVLRGLERNRKLAANLETLWLPNPYLFLHGYKVELPNARVTLIRSANGQTTGSLLIDHVFSPSESQKQPVENPVYSLLKRLPRSCQKRYPNTPPWSADDFQRRFDRQGEAERKLDGSPVLVPCHHRRALHILLAKAYRCDANVYSFIKAKIARYYPDQPGDCRADRSALQRWLSKHPAPSLKDIKTDFWLLARYCPADIHQSIERLDQIDDQVAKKLAIHVVGAADQSRQPSLARRLNVNLRTAREQRFYDGTARSTLRDALMASQASLERGTIISQTVASLEQQIVPVLEKNGSNEQKSEHIKQILIPYFLQPHLPANRLPEHCQDLPEALVAKQRHTWSRQERRLVHLASRVQEHPMVFLQGEAGAGKTFMARAIAARAGYPACQVIQLDPNRTPESLFGGQQLVNHKTGSVTDHHTAFLEGPILQWARSADPPLLLLDEANLAPEGLLAPLAGLIRQPPVINYRGRQYPLTEKHRIILTGNPDYYQGRYLDKTLKSKIPTFYYPPIPDTLLVTAIILPELPDSWSGAMKQQASDRLLTLFKHFRELVPEELTTPRDIKDVLANVRQILSHHYLASGDLASGDLASGDLASGDLASGDLASGDLASGDLASGDLASSDLASGDLSPEQINALIRRAFMDSLAGAVPREQQQRLTSLNLWYQGQFPEDKSVLVGADQVFTTFLKQLRVKNRDADLSPDPIRQLVYRYWQSLDKDDCGRTATLVEGPAGWGKDFILDKTVQLWQKQRALAEQPEEPFVHINANLNQWSTLKECVKKAMIRGQPIAVSELNLIPSGYLEGLFNDVLTGNAAPGFRLFATVNPGTFEGREALSPALKSRCTQVRLGALSQQDLEGMVKRIPYMRNALPRWLAGHFHQLSTALDEQKSPVQLALDDLFASAQHLAGLCSDQWFVAFQQQLSLPFRALKAPLPRVQEDSARLTRQHHQEQRRLEIEGIANRVSGLAAPVTILFGKVPRCGDGEMTVTYNVTDQAVITAVQSMQKTSNGKPASITVDNEQTYQPENATVCLFGDILEPKHFPLTRYFPMYPYDARQYRLTFLETRLDEDGELRNYPIHWRNGCLAPVTGCFADLSWRTDLREYELPGKIELTLNDRWQSLPALTPSDQLRAIRVTPDTDIQLARSEKTGQLLIKHQKQASVRVAIDFIIAPEQIYFYPLESGESLIIQDHLCTRRLQQLLDKTVFYPDGVTCQAYEALRSINNIDEIPQRLNSLMDWLDTFSDDKNVPGQGEQLLLNLLSEKQGVCSHKALIFQILCHYWGIPARQVINTSHVFAEISPDGGNSWRQYQLGGGGQTSEQVSEPDWKDYRQSVRSALQAPVERGGKTGGRYGYSRFRNDFYSSLRTKIANNLDILKEQLTMNNLTSKKEHYHQVKEDLRRYNSLPLTSSGEKILPVGWEVIISPQFFHKCRGERKDWEEIIAKSTLDMGNQRFSREYCNIMEMIGAASSERLNTDYLNWLCDLYSLTPDHVKYYLLSMLQNLIKDCDSSQLKNRVALMEKTYFLNPKVVNFNLTEPAQNQFLTVAKMIPMSRSLTDKVWQRHLYRQLHHQPEDKSILIPEKLMCGEAAFLNQSTLKTCKPIIFDCTSLAYNIVCNKISEQINSGIKSKILTSFFNEQGIRYADREAVMNLFLYWLAEHHKDDSDGPIWLFNHYQYYSILKLSDPLRLTNFDSTILRYSWLKLPTETIKAYFKQPSAVVLQENELLMLLDEFLSLIAH